MNIILIIMGAWIFAELSSGVVHWLEDRYGNPEWPILGRLIVIPNIEHHKHPSRMCQTSYWYRNGIVIIPCVIAAACFYWCPIVCFGFVLMSQVNEIHSWSHRKCGRLIRFGQWVGIFQSPNQHHIHHQQPYDQHFCVMTNYLNPVLLFIRFWIILEWLIYFVFRVKPRPERSFY